MNVFIDGSAGTTGLRIHERLKLREDIRLITLPEAERKSTAARKAAMNDSDVVFLCLPDDAAREAVSLVENETTVIIDASTAHRTAKGWAYGFPELSARHREDILHAKRIANPGCHASGFLALVYPLIARGVAAPDYPFVCHSETGYSGGGKKMIAAYEGEERSPLFDAPRAYGLGQDHKHLAEMTMVAGLKYPPLFLPVVSDFPCGMSVSVPIYTRLLRKKMDANSIFSLFAEYYARHSTIKVTQMSEDGFLSAASLAGTDRMEIFVGGGEDRVTLIARFDNLGKGASGAAIQNMNLVSGLDETASLVL